MVLLSMGILSIALAVAIGTIGHRSGNKFLLRLAVAYVALSVFCLSVRELLSWLKQRRKIAVRRRREKRDSPVKSEHAL